MKKHIVSILEHGNSGIIIDIECALSNALPGMIIVGLGNKSIDESKKRIRSAFAASKINFPRKKITINTAPSDIPKDGSSFDLGMSVAILQTAKLVAKDIPEDTIVLGELSLDGAVKPIRGIVGKLLLAKKLSYNNFIIPKGNFVQASLVPEISIFAVDSLRQLFDTLNSQNHIQLQDTRAINLSNKVKKKKADQNGLDDIVHQAAAKRALVIAAAGHHNILLNGPPGSGKSMLAKAFISILPPPSTKETLEITHLHSLVNKDYSELVTERPLRSRHHISSHVAIIGGGQSPRPGEISLSHNGMLFLDELPEFSKQVVESLRQPLEDRKVTISRIKDTLEFPASFILIATSNPCPYGYYGSKKVCTCIPHAISCYRQKISGPIMDRIDLYVGVDEVEHEKFLQKATQNTDWAKLVSRARALQFERAGKLSAELSNKELITHCKLEPKTELFLNAAAKKLQLSARSYMRVLKLARTIADLDDQESVEIAYITEVLQFRKRESTLL